MPACICSARRNNPKTTGAAKKTLKEKQSRDVICESREARLSFCAMTDSKSEAADCREINNTTNTHTMRMASINTSRFAPSARRASASRRASSNRFLLGIGFCKLLTPFSISFQYNIISKQNRFYNTFLHFYYEKIQRGIKILQKAHAKSLQNLLTFPLICCKMINVKKCFGGNSSERSRKTTFPDRYCSGH